MDKQRVINIYVRSLIRHIQGSGELFERNHIFYEALKLIEKNGWEEEVQKAYEEEVDIIVDNVIKKLKFYDEYNIEKEDTDKRIYNNILNKLGYNGYFRITFENKEKLSSEKLDELVKKREEECNKYMNTFFETQIKINKGEDFNKEEFVEAVKKLKEYNLYEYVIKGLPAVINSNDMKDKNKNYKVHFKFSLPYNIIIH